jgi:dephospho-CoA kinase
VVVEAIKLVEGGLAGLCDEVWLVVCSPAEQLARLRARSAARGEDGAEAEARIAAQSGLVDRLAPSATRMLDTSGDLEGTLADVRAQFRAALAAHTERGGAVVP